MVWDTYLCLIFNTDHSTEANLEEWYVINSKDSSEQSLTSPAERDP